MRARFSLRIAVAALAAALLLLPGVVMAYAWTPVNVLVSLVAVVICIVVARLLPTWKWPFAAVAALGIEIELCAGCGGTLEIVASIDEPEVVAKILAHLQRTRPAQYPAERPVGARAPPVRSSLI